MKILLLSLFVALTAGAREWDAHEVSLRSQIEKIREKEKKITELITQKNTTKDDEKLKPILADLQKEYKALQKMYEEWETEKRHVRFEHPDQGVNIERKYRAYKIRSIEEMENEMGTDGRLTRLKTKVMRKYGEPVSETPAVSSPATPPTPPPEVKKEPDRPKLSY